MAYRVRHFSESEWTDYVRGLTDEVTRGRMDVHLAEGCSACDEQAAMLRKMAVAANSEVAVPKEVVERARSLFRRKSEPGELSWPERMAKLVYDSMRDPALAAGVRTVESNSRQLLYKAGDYCVDIRLERDYETKQVTLTGQIANQQEPHSPVASIPVYLLHQKQVLARTVSNNFGEFHLEYPSKRALRLCLPVAGERIEVPLRKLAVED